jgi:flagellar hook-basal body complex protein FliE
MAGIAPIGGVGIDAISLYRSLPSVGGATAAPDAAPTAKGFGDLIASKLQGAVEMQDTGAKAGQALATGTATDISAATVAVEKAAIALQLTAAFRNKAVEAYQDVMRMQI